MCQDYDECAATPNGNCGPNAECSNVDPPSTNARCRPQFGYYNLREDASGFYEANTGAGPSVPLPTPTAIVDGPAAIGSCDGLTLDGSNCTEREKNEIV